MPAQHVGLPPVTPPAEESSPLMRKTGLFLGPFLFALTYFLAAPEGMSAQGWHVCGLALWMATWWITEAMPLPVGSLLPVVVAPLFGILPLAQVTGSFSSPIIFLFLGGFIISLAMEKCHLHMRIGLGIIKLVGVGGKSILAGLMLATAFMGMWMSNTATVIMMLPMAVSIALLLTEGVEGDRSPPTDNPFAKAMVLGVAYAGVIGGLGTFVGTPTNAILQGHMTKTYNNPFQLSEWMVFGVPLFLGLLGLTWLLLNALFVRKATLCPDVCGTVAGAYAKLGPMKREEKIVAGVFALVAGLWILNSPFEALIGRNVDDATVAILGALLLFIIPVDKTMEKRVLTWKDTQKLPWGILLFFGGSLAISAALTESGVTTWLSGELAALQGVPLVLIVFTIVLLMIVVSEMMNNVATITAFLPILSSLAAAMQVNPIVLLVPATLAASCGFMLPGASAPNALAYGTGYPKVKDMIRAGLLLDIVAASLITLFTFTVMKFAFGVEFGVVPEWAK